MVAPAPGSLETASVLAVGARGDWVPSPATRQGALRVGVTYYADVHRKARNGEGFRITFTTDGAIFRHVDNLVEIPVSAGDKVFVDTLPVQHTDGVVDLLRRGVEVYYLRRLTLLAKRREELGPSKSAKNDIKALMTLDQRWFRKVSEDFLMMRRMIAAYRSLQRTHQQFANKYKTFSEVERLVLKPVIEIIERQMAILATQIAQEAEKRYPAYNRLVETLNIADNPAAKEALAEVLIFPEWRSWRRTRRYFGMWKRDRKTFFHRSKTTRCALERLTIHLKGHPIRGKDLYDVLRMIWRIQKTGTPA